MFTGLVQQIGRIRRRDTRNRGASLEIQCTYADLQVGESVAVSGVCLTATRVHTDGFDADVSAETVARTTLARLKPGSSVNLERALRLSDRLGGHLVAGHVDGAARVLEVSVVGDARRVSFEYPEELSRFVAPKGSVALDGVSLTVNDADAVTFSVMIVPHTLMNSTLRSLTVGMEVNIEVDLMARYVTRLIQVDAAGASDGAVSEDRVRAALERAGLL